MNSKEPPTTGTPGLRRLLAMFPDATEQQWRQAAEQELRGQPLSQLQTMLDEGLEQAPIGWPADLARIPFLDTLPGQAPYLRGTHASLPPDGPWLATARIPAQPAESAAAQIQAAIAQGATALDLAPAAPAELQTLLQGVVPTAVGLFVRSRPGQLLATAQQLAALAEPHGGAAQLRGAVMFDPVAQLAAGQDAQLDVVWQDLADLTHWAAANAPQLVAVTADATLYHEAGGSAVEELAYGLASAVEQTRALLASGAQPGGSVPHVRFEFAIGPRMLPEIAKIRAARLLWARAAAAFGAAPEQRGAVIHACGALRDKTRYDQHANLLRAAVAAFAAVVAGCDSLETARFDVAGHAPDPMAQRLALNTQHLLRDEAHLGRVLDPAGGAYALETLTDVLARTAWVLFQEIESHGGILTALWGGIPQERLAALAAERARQVAERRRVVVGTNRYADPDERLPAAPLHAERHEDMLYPQRDAEAFERVRARADARTPRLRAFLANVGPREQFRPRADFVADLLHSGGIAVLDTPGFPDAETAAAAAAASGAQVVVICAADAAYPALVPDLIARVRAVRPNVVFALAGYPADTAKLLQQAGVDVFLHLRANAVEALTTLLDRTEEARR